MRTKDRFYLTTGEVCRLTRFTLNTVKKWTDRGLMRSVKLDSGHRRVRVDDLVEFMSHRAMRIPPDLADLYETFRAEQAGKKAPDIQGRLGMLSEELSEAKKLLREVLDVTGGENAVLPVPLWDRIYHWLEVKS